MLTAKSVRRLRPDDYALSTVQDALAVPLESALAQPILDGNHFQTQAVVANTAFSINHLLGRTYKGVIVTRVVGANQVLLRDSTPTTTDKTKTITLTPSATGTVDLWIF